MTINIRDIRGLPQAILAMLRGDEEALKRALARDDKDPPRGGSADSQEDNR